VSLGFVRGGAWAARRGGLLTQAAPAVRRYLTAIGPFNRRLDDACAEARRNGQGFYLGGFSARRALGAALIVDVDPRLIGERLKHRVVENGRSQSIRDKFLGAGDWSSMLEPVSNAPTYHDAFEVAAADMDYRRTEAFNQAMERASSSRPVIRNFVTLNTPELVESYFRNVADLCRSVSDTGVVPRSEYRRFSHLFRSPRVRPPWIEAAESDIGVAIGPQGEIYRFASGKHRTAIAQALGLTSIPVEVRVTHLDWLTRLTTTTGLGPVGALLYGIRTLPGAAGHRGA
jgi:hypothetical protein